MTGSRFHLTEPSSVEQFVELEGERSFGLKFLCILKAKVHQHVVGALQIVFAFHHILILPLGPWRASTAFNRFSTNSTSGCGVEMPDLDFF